MDEARIIPKNAQQERLEEPQILSEYQQLRKLIEAGGNGPSISFTWPRYNSYDFHHDGKLTSDELYLVPACDGNPQLQSLLENSPDSDGQIAEVLTVLPDSKIGRALTRVPTKPWQVMAILTQSSVARAARIVICMRECPHKNYPYFKEGFRASRVLELLPEELTNDLLKQIEVFEPQYAINIKKKT